MTSNVAKQDYNLLLKEAIKAIESTGGSMYEALIIEGHFGLMGDWIVDIIHRCKIGQCTAQDVVVINKHLEMYPA
jgi:hypothetical protein